MRKRTGVNPPEPILFAGRGYSIKVLKVGNVVRLIAKAVKLARIVETCSTAYHILVAYFVLYIDILLHWLQSYV
ncbi:MAG: hypothetical protein H3C54_00470 [Taibaiella sp.]|nr:hypothetical protein [Taibaiella sp.]